jgi:hypothetical protein
MLAPADRDDLEDVVLRAWPVHQPEPGRTVTGEVELDPCQAGQIPTYVTVTEKFPGDPAMGEVLKYGQGRVQPLPSRASRSASMVGWKISW